MSSLWIHDGGVLISNGDGVLTTCVSCPCDGGGSGCVDFDWDVWTDGPWETGVDGDHATVDPDTCSADVHWTNGYVVTDEFIGNSSGVFYQIPPRCRRIHPDCEGQEHGGGVVHEFEMTFTIPGSVAHTGLTLAGNLSCDDYLDDILINGVSATIAMTPPGTIGSLAPRQFTITGAFQAGSNTLTFQVRNGLDGEGNGGLLMLAVNWDCYEEA